MKRGDRVCIVNPDSAFFGESARVLEVRLSTVVLEGKNCPLIFMREEVQLVDVFDQTQVEVLFTVEDPRYTPTRATEGSVGWDLKARTPSRYDGGKDKIPIAIFPGERVLVPTGLSIQLPPGYEAQIRPRSGASLKARDVILGTIDSDYRGELQALVWNNTGETIYIRDEERIAQLVVQQAPPVKFTLVNQLDPSPRGTKGWGSSGK